MKKKTVFQNSFIIHACWLVMIILVIRSVKPEVQALPTRAETEAKFHEDIKKSALETAELNSRENLDQQVKIENKNSLQLDSSQEAKLYVTDDEQRNATTGLLKQQIKAFHEKISGTQLHYVAVNQSSAREYTQAEQRQRMQECSEK